MQQQQQQAQLLAATAAVAAAQNQPQLGTLGLLPTSAHQNYLSIPSLQQPVYFMLMCWFLMLILYKLLKQIAANILAAAAAAQQTSQQQLQTQFANQHAAFSNMASANSFQLIPQQQLAGFLSY
jgi:hypothetical protein